MALLNKDVASCILTLLIFILFNKVKSQENLARGLGDNYKWFSLNDGLEEAKSTNKPLMLIIHKSWCSACKAFKPKFAASKEALTLSRYFVMVNLLDDEEPKDSKYSPDGGYIPRILFLDSGGNVQRHLYNNGGNPNYKYFYYDDTSVVKVMKEAINAIGSSAKHTEEL